MTRLRPYAFAVVAVAMALLVRLLADPALGDRQPFPTFYVSVAIVAWLAGLWPGVLALILGYLAGDWFFLAPRGALNGFSGRPADEVGALLYVFVGSVFLILTQIMRRAQVHATALVRRAEDEATQRERSEARFRSLVLATAQVVWTSTPEGLCSEDSPTWRAFTGQSFDEMKGWGWLGALHPDDRDRVRAAWSRCVAERSNFEVEYRLRRPDGSDAWTLARATPVLRPDGAIREWVGTNTDVTARRLADEAAQQREARFRRFYESNIVGVAFCDAHSILEANDAFLRIIGYGRDDLPIADWQTGTLPEYRELEMRAIAETHATGTCPPYEKELARRDGTRVPVLVGAARVTESPLRWMTFALDITLQKHADTVLRASEDRFRRVVESNVIGILFWDASGPIADANDAFLEMAGRTRDDLRAGRLNWRELIPAERLALHESSLEEIRDRGISTPLESELMRPDGTRIPILCAGTRFPGEPIHGATWVLDISAQKQAEAEREALLAIAERARAEAEAASHAKDEFLAMLGHELRNPLSAVQNAVVTARFDDARRDRALEIARRGTEQLVHLIDDLLDVARITQGRITLRKEPTSLAGVIERAVEATRSLVEERGHDIQVTLPPADVRVEADPARLEQVVVNLLTNATKYTDPGGRIALTAQSDGAEVTIRVRDSGIGIAPDMLPRVFDLFAQADRTPDRSQGGLGIGLTIVKRLVELHGGRVTAQSDGLGKGAEFFVRLPALPTGRADLRATALVPQSVHHGSTQVLLVEDNPDAADSLMMLLELLGHRVRVVHDGLTALDLARAKLPDVMLVDIGLPGIDGYEVARRVRSDPRLRHVVLVALTGYGREEDRQHAMAAGFDYHLTKPVEPDALTGLVARLGKPDAKGRDRSTLH